MKTKLISVAKKAFWNFLYSKRCCCTSFEMSEGSTEGDGGVRLLLIRQFDVTAFALMKNKHRTGITAAGAKPDRLNHWGQLKLCQVKSNQQYLI
jgi:hypothetical protein